MTEIVTKLGNSLGVRIPQPVANEVGFTVGTEINIEVVNNTIVISSVKRKYQLEDLLIGVTPELIGGEYDWGQPAGKETW
ncbi:AbrB/MazE/SpoVT family DNA-binding domain-containing protein [Chamaesiphon sp. VAR_48_metabat_403]|uniref:AbrB/MazE/SpoVT family DNA-binding domain-containing protein n=1 Tax=Chamaesiphon sp. VAR_48_metabat_403 TaxID=2964700 RepID=UPI00286EA421|nr:AbrB/MazE/SpoVT family DNA-binding domain-containing protein [Chamaesiphon sp. VAR_48_metabat_403]